MRAEVQQYYGQVLQSSADLKTSACCTDEAPPEFVKEVLAQIHDEVLTRYYGCGLVLPEALDGAHVLDLGCGAGRDVFVLSRLVGESGRVIGVDMTPEQLAVARRHRDHHARQFGYRQPNTEFVEADIERLQDTDLGPESFDLLVSNCVVNLAQDKRSVLEQAWRLLRPGGEMYFADIYADRRIPEGLRTDPVLYGECLAGALYWNDFLALARAAGFTDPRLVADRPVTVEDKQLAQRVGDIRFYSATYRLFKLENLEPACEDYGQAVRYLGTAPHAPEHLRLDKHHVFQRGKTEPVCGNTWRMLKESRLATHFDFMGDDSRHFGIFPGCGISLPFDASVPGGPGGCC